MKYSGGRSIEFPISTTLAPDGTRLRYFDSGAYEQDPKLPVVVLANGLGGPASVWIPYLERWRGRYRLLSWDYRATYGSIVPHSRVDLSVAAHARDLDNILDHAGIERAHYLGWSMGVQVGLEFYSQNPNRLSHLSFISGTFGRPLRSVALPFAELTLPPLVRQAGRLKELGAVFLETISRSSLSYSTLLALRAIAPGLSRQHYQVMIDDFKAIDLRLYFQLLQKLGEHDAEKALRKVQVPALVMAGARDFLTPPALARKIAQEIPRSELFIIPGATHYSTVEYPEVVAERLEKFFETTANGKYGHGENGEATDSSADLVGLPHN